jgi:hypothetical protein
MGFTNVQAPPPPFQEPFSFPPMARTATEAIGAANLRLGRQAAVRWAEAPGRAAGSCSA